jgi:hypothetical protein
LSDVIEAGSCIFGLAFTFHAESLQIDPCGDYTPITPTLDAAAAGVSIGEFRFTMNGFSQNLVRLALVGLCAIFGFAELVGAAREETSGSIQQMMTPEEFKAAGLNKLSPEELQKLDAWLQGYRQVAEQAGEKKGTARAERTKMDLIVSRVDGTFNGLTGRTVIRLEDGTVWKQANADDRFRPKVTDHPAAAVIHGIFGYKMRIEGTQEFYVDPVRHP